MKLGTARLLALVLLLGLSAAAGAAPVLRITTLPAYGTTEDITGTVSGVTISSQTVALYVFTSGWWTKPTFLNPTVPVGSDGTWTGDITTGGNDLYATKIAAFLLPGGVTPPQAQGTGALPASLGTLALASVIADRPAPERILTLGGREWRVKQSMWQVGPGTNYFSGDPADIWSDAEGMHLSIVNRDGKWWCTEVILKDSLGYGMYFFQTHGRLDTLPACVVAGFFTWDDYAPAPYREIDFEYARWGNAADPTNAQYVIQPATVPGQRQRITVNQSADQLDLTHVLVWSPGRTWFRTFSGRVAMADLGKTQPIAEWEFLGPAVPVPGSETWRVNFWLSQLPTTETGPFSIIMSDFRFVPLRSGAPLWPE